MYLPSPSCVMPRLTLIPVFGTSANLIVSFGCAQIASARSLPTLSVVDVERGRELDVGDVVAAEVHVHQAGDELVVRRVLVVLRRPGRASWRSCRRRRSRRGPCPWSAPCRWWSRSWKPWFLSIACEGDLERVGERREHEVVDVQLAAPSCGLELAAELRRHAQHDRAGRPGNRLPAAAAG